MQVQAITAPTADTLGFCARAALHPERVAVVNPDTTTVSYGELLRQVNQLSHGLRALGLGRESTVCLATRNHYVYFAAALACEQIGVYLVPVNWHLTAAETQYIVKNSQAELAIVGDGLEAMMTAALDEAGLPADCRFSVNGAAGMRPLSDITDGRSDALPEGRMAASQMLYTSGTTGIPKGVRRPVFDMEPEQLLAVLRPMFDERGMGPGDGVFFGPAPLYHAAPGFHALWALHAGYEVVLMDHWDSEAALAAIERHRVTHTHLAPIHIQRWLALPDQVRTRYDVSSLRRVIHAGAPCPVEVKRKAIEWIGPVLFEYYAGSEGGFTSVTCEEWLEHPGTVGNVGAGSAEIRVVDEETGGALPPGGIGLVYAKVMLPFEYHRDAEKTAATQTTDGFFTLGDLGYVDEDGWLFLVDRRTDMILSGGVNVYPAEVEARLTEHPAVLDAAVVGVPDEQWGQRVVAAVVPKDETRPSLQLADELIAHCRQALAKFKCPSEVLFRESLPRLPSGKLQRRLLRDELASVSTTTA
jgi:long-chain acyl-CoA synthetase